MRHARATDVIQSKTRQWTSSWRLPLGVGITPTTFYPCQPWQWPVTLYCMRPQAIRGSPDRSPPIWHSVSRRGTPGPFTAAPTRLTRSKTHESSQDVIILRCLSG